ncbi:MAG: prepilin-type N-terminal cleavage/methylation domain-containing protein [Phycisphaerae bacterium]|nr:prepilin-type N-terminal cleavage/methylation domain-containing protein [Phycisphaerae bacterium]
MNHQMRSGGLGFTLIEVLVVIAIISLLISILIPSLARGRENARSVVCRSNLSHLGRAMLMYGQEFRGMLPYENRPDPADPLQHGRLCWYDAVDRYLKTAENQKGVKICPTVERDDPQRIEGYRMNSKLAESNAASPYYRPYRKVDTLKRPFETVMLFDADVGGEVVSLKGRWRISRDDVNYRHNDATNLLYVEGNVENSKRRPLRQRSINNTPVIWQPPDLGAWDPDPETE